MQKNAKKSAAHVGLPSEEELARWLCAQEGQTPEQVEALWTEWLDNARELLGMFRPAFEAKDAEIERLTNVADSYAACESVARKRLAHIDPALEEILPSLCQIDRKTWLLHKERLPIMAADMLEHAKIKAAEAKLAQAVEALEPFAKRADGTENLHDDLCPAWAPAFRVGDFRRARSASAAARGETR